MTDPYPRPDQAYTLCGTHAVTGVETEVFCGLLPDAAPLAGALTRLGVTFAVAPLRVAAPDPQATGRVPQLAIELAAVAHEIDVALSSYLPTATRPVLSSAHTKLLALADRVQAEGSDCAN